MKVYIKKVDVGTAYVYEERADGLFYQVVPKGIAALTGYTEEKLIAAGFTLMED